MGDCLRPLLHSIHCGLIRPQKDGPGPNDNKSAVSSFAYARALICI